MTSLRHRPLLFALLVALQVAIVAGATAREEVRLERGREILVRTLPVDPRDPLRGDYVVLRYEIELVPHTPARPLELGQTVWAILERQPSGRWEAVRYSPRRPPPPVGDQVALRGTVQALGDHISVRYPNIGRFYVREGAGQIAGTPDVVLSVTPDGVARVRRLVLDGETIAGSR